MSVHVTSLVWKLDLPSTVKLVLLKLADHARDDGSGVYPSQSSVAKETGLCDRTVRSVISQAVEFGVLEESPSPGNRPNVYSFCLGEMATQVEYGSRWNMVPGGISQRSTRNVVPPTRNVVPPINKKHQLNVSNIDDWETFLSIYPKRSGDRGVAKGKAKFLALAKTTDVNEIIDGARRYLEYCKNTDRVGTEYVKQIPTFLNSESWKEEFLSPTNPGTNCSAPKPGRVTRTLEEALAGRECV